MKTLKRIVLSCALLCASALSASAQSASDITVSGVLYNAFNDVCTSCTFTVTVTRRDGVAVQSTAKTVTSNSSTGAVSFTLPRKCLATFTGNYTVGRYSWKSGISLFIPDQSTADIVDLQSVDDAIASLTATASAPSNAQYVVGTANSTLSAEQSLGALTTGLLKNTVSGSTGTLSTATAGTDYENPLTFAARLSRSTNTIDLAASGVTAGTCTACDLTIDTYGRVTAKANGSGGGGGTWGSITGTLSSQTDLQAALDAKQPLDSDLTAMAGNSTNGLWARTGSGTGSARTIAGTTDKITVTDGDGVSGNPTLTIASTYAGQNTITTLGTIATGVWNGSVIGSAYGGAGTVSGLLKANGSGTVSGAVSATDYAPATSGSAILKGNGSGGFSNAAAGTDYESPLTFSTGLTRSTNTITVNTSQNIATLSNLTSNGLVTTSGGAGTLGVTVPGTGVLTALGVNIGSAGAPVLFNGAGGTPSSVILTNATGLPPTTGISGWPANSSGVLTNNGSGTLSWAASSGANTALSNLASVSINASLIPQTTLDLGAAATAWRNLYIYGGGTFGSHSIKFDGTPTGNRTVTFPDNTGTVAELNLAQTFSAAQSFSSTITQTSASATAFESGPNGGTNPVFRLVNSTASAATGLSITGNAAGSHVTLSALSSGASESILIAPKGATGTLRITTSLGTSVFQDASYALSLPGAIRDTSTFFVGSGGGFTGLLLGNAMQLKWSSTTNWFDTSDLFLRRSAAATLAYGAADANPPVAQSQIVQSATGTNIAGATWTRQASLGTSQGVPGRHSFTAGAMIAASGTTQQAAVSRLELGATKVLTNNSATTITNATAASNSIAGGVLDYLIEVFDGTELQTEVGSVSYTLVNKGGAFSGNTMTKFGNSQTATSGTLTVTFAISAANPGVISVNANSSLTPSTGYPRITYMPRNLSQNAISIQ